MGLAGAEPPHHDVALVIRTGCYAALLAAPLAEPLCVPLPEPLPIFGQLWVGAAEGVAAVELDGDVAEVVDVDADGALPCVAAMATVAVPAPSPPARTAVIAALRSSVPLANAMDASPSWRAAVRLAMNEGWARELAAGRRRAPSTFWIRRRALRSFCALLRAR